MARDARTHRALQSDDVVTKIMAFLSLPDGWHAAMVCKAYRACWQRRCRGMLRFVRIIDNPGPGGLPGGLNYNYIGDAPESITATPGGGVIVVNHGIYAHWVTAGTLETYSSEGHHLASRRNLGTPTAMALRGDGTAWVIWNGPESELVCVTLGASEVSEPILTIDFWNLHEAGHEDYGFFPVDLARAGDRLLVLCCDHNRVYEEVPGPGTIGVHRLFGRVMVLDNQTGAHLSSFGTSAAGYVPNVGYDKLHAPSSLAVQDQYCFIADTHNHHVKVFDWRTGTLVRVFGRYKHQEPVANSFDPYWRVRDYDHARRGSGSGEFNEPCGIAVRDGKLYVSEMQGCRIQVFRLPDDMRGPSDLELLQYVRPRPAGPPGPWNLSGAGRLCVDDDGQLWCIVENNTKAVQMFRPCV